MPPNLAIKLLVSPTQLSMAERAQLTIGLEVENRGPDAVDPQIAQTCELFINGAASVVWNLALGGGSGAREPRWHLLPPQQTVSVVWPLGVELFPRPGSYHLVMKLAGQESRADVRVTP